ncbi:MAG: helix-turn-helix domain-containing protein [Actinomycetota bacterium]|jgi:citrate synthase|nr:helix-turn-helix domain-containing protein [Actinomycetota bacterium]
MAPGRARAPKPDPQRWLSTSQVASLLGIKRATVYAYVSRGMLRRMRRPGQRDSWFDVAEIEEFLASRATRNANVSV